MRYPKPEPYAKVKARRRRNTAKARKECARIVWLRDGARCQRCGRGVLPPDQCSGWEPWRGDVNERIPRSKGGDPTDPDNAELLCQACHFGGPSGAHAPTTERMKAA